MAITVEAIYEAGVLKPAEPLPFREHEKVQVTVRAAAGPRPRAYGVVGWTGSLADLDYLIEDSENDPAETP